MTNYYIVKAGLEYHVFSQNERVANGAEVFEASFLQKEVAEQFRDECIWLDQHEINEKGELVHKVLGLYPAYR